MGRSHTSNTILPPFQVSSLSAKYFSPFLKPQRLVRQPVPPSLAWSKLPPPAAEIDERPTARVRRFKLWRTVTPELRVAVLDPRRRGCLIRYRTFAIPCPSQQHHGRLSRSTRPFQSIPRPLPSRPPPRPSPVSRGPSSMSPSPPFAAPLKPPKLPKFERDRAHDRLLEHKWVLDQEHERRFRRGIAVLMQEAMEFQEANTLPFEEWQTGSNWHQGVIWKDGVDLGRIAEFACMFRAVRKSSYNIYQYLNPDDIAPVPGLQAVHHQVKAEERRTQKRREKKERKRQEKKAAEVKAVWEAEEACETCDSKRVKRVISEEMKEIEHEEVCVERVPLSACETSAGVAPSLGVTDDDGSDTLKTLVDRLLELRVYPAQIQEQGRRRRESCGMVSAITEDKTSKTDYSQDKEATITVLSHSTSLPLTLRLNNLQFRPGSLNLDDDTALPSHDAPTLPSSGISFRDNESTQSTSSPASSFDAAEGTDNFNQAENQDGDASSQLTAMTERLALL